jgi:hypothetical protein
MIAHFRKRARSVQERHLNAIDVVQELLDDYRATRITRFNLEDNEDMLLFQWGVGKHALPTQLGDLRGDDAIENGSKPKVEFDCKDLAYLDVTRQVLAAGEDESEELDDSAIQMSLTLIYGPGGHEKESGNLWISLLSRMNQDLKQFVGNNPFVMSMLDLAPSRYVATVDFVG